MEMLYRSTRGNREIASASLAMLNGLAPDGGLYVPDHLPRLEKSFVELSQMTYHDIAYEVMRQFLTDFSQKELRACIRAAYDEKFDTPQIAPITVADGRYFLELWHGKTMAFKDMALSILPYLMANAAHKLNEEREIVILTATSGDTGKAALAGFADVPGTKIIVFYPKHGVSPVQEKQMVTQEGDNVLVVGIKGNFDDAQNGVKVLFTDEGMRARMNEKMLRFSSANSINIGRLVPQIAYYVASYAAMLREEEIGSGSEINICVPTGNFGNILAAYYARWMGLPVHKLICASNSNKVLFDFFRQGVYDKEREFITTQSPSMDILISSNLERLIYHTAGDDAEKCAALMKRLSREGHYEISREMEKELSCFAAGYATEEECAAAIRELYDTTGYLIDTHTAVGAAVHRKYVKETGDDRATLIASTASPYKFPRAVWNALQGRALSDRSDATEDEALAERLSKKSGMPLPEPFLQLKQARVRHNTVCEKEGMRAEVERFLGL
ncbi:MAG: threonine synthase [Lachnospiraceae bacterium]|nr:threonine synthase [Lachnospiraceae bacterium]